MDKHRSKQRRKQCIKCLEYNPSGSTECAHCGEVFIRSKTGKIIKQLRIFFDKVGRKKIG